MIRKAIIIVLLLAVTLQQCQKGCLRCTASNTCSFCDITNNYYQVNNTCAITTLTNCAVLTQAGTCTLCASGFYLDANTAKCLAVPTNNTIANCAAYSPAYACNSCADGYYISNGACVQANITVANCQKYGANGACLLCASGYIQSLDTLTCVAASAGNCLAYTYFTCTSCNSGYFLNPNLYFTSFVPGFDLSMYFGLNRRAYPLQLSVCQQMNVTNCAVALNAFTCQTCNSGYYLSNGLCVQNPAPIIPNCATYSSLTTCTSCAVGFFLASNACTAVVPIAFCVTYSTTQSPTTCIACNSTSFVNNNACAVRTRTITNCLTYNPLADQCLTCATNFRLTTDFLNCLAVIPNCATYATWTAGQTAFSCQTCSNGYLITTANNINTCTAGTLTGCAQYTSSTACASCLDTYWLNTATNLCVKSMTLTNCATYDPLYKDSCLQCATGFVALTIFQGCIPIPNANAVTNCIKYNEGTLACTACAAGFYLNGNPAVCTAIPAASNCASMDGSQNCLNCTTGLYPYAGASPKTCVALFDYVSANCNVTSTDTTFNVIASNNFCSVCKTGNIPYVTNFAEGICVKNADLAVIYGNANWAVTNCVRYGLNIPTGNAQAVLVCMECSSGNFILGYDQTYQASANRTCGACSTTGGAAVIVPDDFLGTVNICVAPGRMGLSATQYGIRMARVKYNNNQVGDYQFTTADPTGLLSISSLAFTYEAPPASTTTALTTSNDYNQGFTTIDTGINPSVFNYRGLPIVTVIQKPTVATFDWTANCEISFTFSGVGSVYKTGGTAGGAGSGYWTVLSGNTQRACMRCQLGYQLSFAAMNPPPATSGNAPYPKCAAMSNTACTSTTIVVGGLPTYLNGMISCFACAANTFPWVYFEYNSVLNGGIMNNVFLNHLMKADQTGFGFTCAASANVVTGTATTTSALANCAVFGSLAANTNTDPATETIAGTYSYCLACAAGFVPGYSSTAAVGGASSPSYIPFYAVISCTASANCDASPTNVAYNTCGRCSTASVSATPPVYYAYTDHTMSNCLASFTNNCFLLKAAGLSANTSPGNACGVCVSGYFLNQDGVCELLTIPNIGASASFSWAYYPRQFAATASPTNGWDSVFARIHYLLSFQKQTYGASACATGYTRAPASQFAPSFCVQSAYLTAATFVTNSQFIASCTYYFALSTNTLPNAAPLYKCAACSGALTLYSDFSGCVTALTNCRIVSKATPTKCAVCNTGFFNINGACSQPTLPTNCTALANTVSSMNMATLTCGRCASGMFLNANQTCSPGPVLNCDQYAPSSTTLCGSCLSGFTLISLSQTLNYCFPTPAPTANYNCVLRAQTQANVNGDCALDKACLTCSTCNTVNNVPGIFLQYAAANSPSPWTVCAPFNLIPNCQTYNQAKVLPGYTYSNFTCSLCNAGYYIGSTGYTCVKRVNMPAACATYNNFADVCTFCNSGFFLSADGTNCIVFPTGVVNCAVYSAATTCSQCASGYYLSNGACLQSTVINNCVTYSANYTCTACTTGYMLVNATTCSQATAQNCATYTSLTVCATCAFGYTLQTANSVTSCSQVVIANCAILNPTNQAACGYCNTGFYLNSAGACVAVTTTIANCLYYSGAAKCSNCTAPNVLSVDGSACYSNYTNLAEANCANQFATAAPSCTFCALGYTFSGGACTACSLVNSGCLVCDFSNATNCLLCNTASYMDSTGKCNANAPLNNNTGNNTTTTTPSSSGRFVASLSLALTVVMFGMG